MTGNTVPATPAQAFPVPIDGNDPDIPDDMNKLAKAIEKRVMGVYASAADRDSKTTSAGLVEGMFAYMVDSKTVAYFNGTSWVAFPPRQMKIGSGTSVPSAGDPNYIDGDVFFRI
jgi:hypothetical protein